MDPSSFAQAKALLATQGLRPRKRWGQNFLCERNLRDRIADAALLEPVDHVLEIGPGLGTLTRALADRAAQVTAVEIDLLLEPILQETLADKPNVRILYEDFLKLDSGALLDEAFESKPGVVVANIPYYITTPILERLLEEKARIKRIVLLVQQEFAKRMAAAPATEDYGSMTVFAQYHARVEIVMKVERRFFLPAPEVDSAVIRLTPALPGTVEVKDEALFFRVVRAAFQQRRKTLANTLIAADFGLNRESAESLLRDSGIDPARRGETLSLDEFAAVADQMAEVNPAARGNGGGRGE